MDGWKIIKEPFVFSVNGGKKKDFDWQSEQGLSISLTNLASNLWENPEDPLVVMEIRCYFQTNRCLCIAGVSCRSAQEPFITFPSC